MLEDTVRVSSTVPGMTRSLNVVEPLVEELSSLEANYGCLAGGRDCMSEYIYVLHIPATSAVWRPSGFGKIKSSSIKPSSKQAICGL